MNKKYCNVEDSEKWRPYHGAFMERWKTHEAQQRQTSVDVAEHNGLSIYKAINNYRESHIALMSRTNTHEVYENNFILSEAYHFCKWNCLILTNAIQVIISISGIDLLLKLAFCDIS